MGRAGMFFSTLAIAAGAVMHWAVTASGHGFNVSTVGIILMIVGVVGLVASGSAPQCHADLSVAANVLMTVQPSTQRGSRAKCTKRCNSKLNSGQKGTVLKFKPLEYEFV